MRLGQLRDAVEGLPAELNGEELAEACTLADQLTARVTLAARRFDNTGGPELDAAQSLPAWLRGFARRGSTDAARIAAQGRRLGDLPVTAELWRSGALSSAQISIISHTVTLRRLPLFAQHEHAVAPSLVGLDLRDTEIAMRRWAEVADATLGEPEPVDEPRCTLRLAATIDGRHEGIVSLDAEGGAVVVAALEVFERPNGPGELRLRPERRADALIDLCRWALDHQ
ncbi:MAG: DUF222 domain-containing protein, partial [Acidimicrobiales bacterium]